MILHQQALAEHVQAPGRFDGGHAAGAAAQRVERKGSAVGKQVENAAIARQALDEPAVLALVAIEAGLLATFELGDEMETALLEGHFRGKRAPDGLRDQRQAPLAARRKVAQVQDGCPRKDPAEGLIGGGTQSLETSGGDLADKHRAEPVDDQAIPSPSALSSR